MTRATHEDQTTSPGKATSATRDSQTPVAVEGGAIEQKGNSTGLESGGVTIRRRNMAARGITGMRGYLGALAALVVIVGVLTATQDRFLTIANLQNVLQTNAPLFLISVGMTFVIISAGFDLSVGAVMAVSEQLLLLFIDHWHLNPLLAVVMSVLLCGVIGAVTNGIAVGVFRLNFFVATLGTMTLLQGLVLVVSNGSTSVIESTWLSSLGNRDVGIFPIPILIAAGLLVLAWCVLRLTAFGRAVYCVGGNAEAARLSGISVPLTIVGVYGLSGLCGGLAGVVDAGRLVSATPTAGSTIALTSATAVLLGGASLAGGVGKLAGMTIGVLVLAVLSNGVDLFGLTAYWQDVVTGAVLLIAVLLDRAHKSGLLQRRGRRNPADEQQAPALTGSPTVTAGSPQV